MSKPTLTYPILCLITDPTVPDLVTKVEQALSAGVNMLQLRGHTLSAAELYRLALALRPLCQRHRATFIVNDRIEVGLATGADGFQLGARSLPLTVARQLIGEDYLLGASVHSCEEALAAKAGGADFLLAGTIFASHTHPGELPSGTDLLRAIKQVLPTCPAPSSDRHLEEEDHRRGVGLSPPTFSCQKPWAGTSPRPYDDQILPTLESCLILAIGGITATNAKQVIEAGADGIAVISAILGADNVRQAVRELVMAIEL